MSGAGLRLIGVHTAISIRGNYRHFNFRQDRGRYRAEASFQPNRHFNPSPLVARPLQGFLKMPHRSKSLHLRPAEGHDPNRRG